MSLKIAIQMDPIEGVDIDADSTFALALEAQARGHSLIHYLPRHLALRGGRLIASGRDLAVKRERGRHAELGAFRTIDLAEQDVILLRQDPPFDLAYITTTHLLEHVQQRVLIVNDPVSVRNAPEKLLVTFFQDLAPPTLITQDTAEVAAFRAEHKDIIVKPLYGNGGAGVVRIRADDENLNSILEMNEALYKTPFVVQAYLPAVREGDKRIILIDGEAAGALNRRPKEGEARANLHVGGKSEAAELTKREHEICEAIGPLLKERGLLFTGIDVIGGYLTEINVTSPTGIQEISRFTGRNLAGAIWDAIERRWRARH